MKLRDDNAGHAGRSTGPHEKVPDWLSILACCPFRPTLHNPHRPTMGSPAFDLHIRDGNAGQLAPIWLA